MRHRTCMWERRWKFLLQWAASESRSRGALTAAVGSEIIHRMAEVEKNLPLRGED